MKLFIRNLLRFLEIWITILAFITGIVAIVIAIVKATEWLAMNYGMYGVGVIIVGLVTLLLAGMIYEETT